MTNDAVDESFIRKLVDLLTESDLSELEVETQDMRVRVARNPGQPVPAVAAAGAPVTVSSTPEDEAPTVESSLPAGDVITSPMVGTIFIAPEPGAAPFVQAGADVTEGQTLFIIEAMKTMNHIPAPHAGKVAKILVEDGQPVEYGEPLCILN